MNQSEFLVTVGFAQGTVLSGAIPAAPSGLVAAGTFAEIQVDWTNNASYDSLVFERQIDAGVWEPIVVTPEQASYIDHPIDDGSYTYRIHGVVNGVSSATVVSNTLVIEE